MICVQGTLAHQVGRYIFPSPEQTVLMTTPPETGDGNPKSPPPSIVGLLLLSCPMSHDSHAPCPMTLMPHDSHVSNIMTLMPHIHDSYQSCPITLMSHMP